MFHCFCHKESWQSPIRQENAGPTRGAETCFPTNNTSSPVPTQVSGGANNRYRPFYPIPRIPEFESLVANESDSDNELPSQIMSAATSPSQMPGSKNVAGNGKKSFNPLSRLRAQVGSFRHTPSTEVAPVDDAERLAVAARRAEVRRLTLQRIKDELRREKQAPYKPRSFRRPTMTTIKEDPFDSAGEGLSHRASGSNQTHARGYAEYNPPRRASDSAVHAGMSRSPGISRNIDPARPMPAMPGGSARSFSLKRPSESISLPRGLKTRNQWNGTVKDKHWGKSTLMTFEPLHIPGVTTPDNENADKKESEQAKPQCVDASEQTDVSGSLGSLDEEGSVHEAQEAHVIVVKKPEIPAAQETEKAASGHEAQERDKLYAVTESPISPIDLPAAATNEIDQTDETKSKEADKPSPKNGEEVNAFNSQSVPTRKGLKNFSMQFRSILGLGIAKGLKELGAEPETRSVNRIPESWRNVSITLQNEHRTESEQATTGSSDESLSSPENMDDGKDDKPPSSRLLPTSIEKVFKMGISKLISLGHPAVQPLEKAEETDAKSRETLKEASFNESDEEKPENQSDKIDPNGAVFTPFSPSTEVYTSSRGNESQDILGEIDSIFGILINVDSNQDKPVKKENERSQESKSTDPPGKVQLPLTAPSTPVSKAYAEVQAYIITAFPENTGPQEKKQATSSDVSDYSDAVSHHNNRVASPTPKAEAKKKRGESRSAESVRMLKKVQMEATAPKYKTWNGSTKASAKTSAGLMKSTVDFKMEMERILHGEKHAEQVMR